MKERRFAPRYSCDFPVLVETQAQRYELASSNLSAMGLALQLPQPVKQTLAESGVNLDTGNHLKILLPRVNEAFPSVLMECQVQYMRRLSQDSWLMGCQFVELDESMQQLIEKWITQLQSS